MSDCDDSVRGERRCNVRDEHVEAIAEARKFANLEKRMREMKRDEGEKQ